jgi:hypothetical protein
LISPILLKFDVYGICTPKHLKTLLGFARIHELSGQTQDIDMSVEIPIFVLTSYRYTFYNENTIMKLRYRTGGLRGINHGDCIVNKPTAWAFRDLFSMPRRSFVLPGLSTRRNGFVTH